MEIPTTPHVMAFTATEKAGAKQKEARREVERALALNPNCGGVRLRGDWAYQSLDLDGAEAAFRKRWFGFGSS